MPLEFTAISPKAPDVIELVAAIPLQAHECIMLKAYDYELKLLYRMAEYWEDALYENGELEQLRMELTRVCNLLKLHEPDAERLAELISKMLAVIDKAQEIGGNVEAIAD